MPGSKKQTGIHELLAWGRKRHARVLYVEDARKRHVAAEKYSKADFVNLGREEIAIRDLVTNRSLVDTKGRGAVGCSKPDGQPCAPSIHRVHLRNLAGAKRLYVMDAENFPVVRSQCQACGACLTDALLHDCGLQSTDKRSQELRRP